MRISFRPPHSAAFHASSDDEVLMLFDDPGSNHPQPGAAQWVRQMIGNRLEVAGELCRLV